MVTRGRAAADDLAAAQRRNGADLTWTRGDSVCCLHSACFFARCKHSNIRQSRCKVVIPYPAGSTPDIVGRTLSSKLQDAMGQPFVVENRTGAGGNIGAEAVAKAPAGRLHAADRHQRPGGDQQVPVQEPELRLGQGSGADIAARDLAADAGGRPVVWNCLISRHLSGT